MRREPNRYEVFVYTFAGAQNVGGAAGEVRGDSKTVPDWARDGYLDIVNDGGCPVKVKVQGSTDLYCETGDRLPLTGQAELTFSRDQDQIACLGQFGTHFKAAFVGAEVAQVTPPPTKNASDVASAVENVVHLAASRQIVPPATAQGFRQISLFNLGPVTVYLGETAAQATALAIPLPAGESVDWPPGPLFTKNPDAATDQTINVAYRRKRF